MKQQLIHKHYIAQSNRLEILENFKGKVGFFIRVFFINDKINGNDWRVTWEGIKLDITDVIGLPIVTLEDLDHPSAATQDFFAKGYIIDFVLHESTHTVEVVARIFDEEVKQGIMDKTLKFVSPAVVPRDSLSVKQIDGIDVLSRFIPLHLAIVARPAYGRIVARLHDVCTGTGDFCMDYLKPKTASLTAENPRVKLLSEWLAEHYEPEVLEQFVANATKMESCISRTIKELENNPSDEDRSHEQIIAIAFSKCRESIGEHLGDSAESKVGPLTQIPLLRKVAAQTAYIASLQDQIMHHAKFPVYGGQSGNWIHENDMWVFVARNQTVDDAVENFCPCSD